MLGRANTTLKPDRDLLNTRFEQYKYTSGRGHDIIYKDITEMTPHRVSLPDSDYSYQLTKTTCLFNFLFPNRDSTRFLTISKRKSATDTFDLTDIEQGIVLWSCDYSDHEVLIYNITLKWSTADTVYIIIGNELHKLRITSTQTSESASSVTFPQHRMLLYCKCSTIVTCYKEDNVFVHVVAEDTESPGNIEYRELAKIKLSGIASFVSLKNYLLTLVSEGKIVTDDKIDEQDTPDVSADTEQDVPPVATIVPKPENKINYTWTQTIEYVEVVIDLPNGIIKTDLIVDIGLESLEVRTKGGQELLHLKLFGRVEPQDSVWTISDKTKLEVHLSKYQIAHNWAALADTPGYNKAGDVIGNISDISSSDLENMMKRIRSLDQYTSDTIDKSPLYVPTEDLEECDELDGEQVLIAGYDVTKNYTQKYLVELTPGSLLFTQQDIGFAISHNVDAVFYKTCDLDLPWQHVTSYHAFSMILSSKIHKKYVITGPARDYAAVIDMKRNVFVYKTVANEPSGKMMVITLDNDDSDIIGAHAMQNKIILLTQNSYITINFTL